MGTTADSEADNTIIDARDYDQRFNDADVTRCHGSKRASQPSRHFIELPVRKTRGGVGGGSEDQRVIRE